MEEIEERALELVSRSKDGILLSQLGSELGTNSRRCTRIVRTLLDAGMVERESLVVDRVRTYMIRFVGESKSAIDISKYELLVAGDVFDPCVGCTDECKPTRCAQLNKWIRKLGAES